MILTNLQCGCEYKEDEVFHRKILEKDCGSHTPKPGFKAPKKEPVLVMWHPPLISIYCSGCDNPFYKRHPHRITGMGHVIEHGDSNTLDEAFELYHDKWVDWFSNPMNHKGTVNFTGIDYKTEFLTINKPVRGQSRINFMKYNSDSNEGNAPILTEEPYVIKQEFIDGRVKIKPLFPEFTAAKLLNFTYFYLVKRTYNGGKSSDQEIWNKDFKGEDILEDLANDVILEFYERTARGVPIRSIYGFIATIARQVLNDWRKTRAETRLRTIPEAILSQYEDIDNPMELYDIYAATKDTQREHELDSLTKLLNDIDRDNAELVLKQAELGKIIAASSNIIEAVNNPDYQELLNTTLTLHSIEVTKGMKRAALNALLGKNKGLKGNKQTRKQLRAFKKAIEPYTDRPDIKKLIEIMTAKSLEVSDNNLEAEATRWKGR